MRLRAVLVDDEYPARGELRCLLEEIGGIDIVGEYEDGDETLALLEKEEVDIVFLDIQMSAKDGLTVAEEIMDLSRVPKIVFTTGYSEHAVQAFELNAVDYLIKPYSRRRLEHTLIRILDLKKAEQMGDKKNLEILNRNKDWGQGRFPVWDNDRLVVLEDNKIFFAKALEKRKTVICTDKGNYMTSLTLKEIENRLSYPKFLRTHKSFIINMEKVREVIPWFNNTYVLLLEGCPEKNLPVSRHYLREFKQVMGI